MGNSGNSVRKLQDKTEYGFTINPPISSVSYFILGGLKLCSGVLSPQMPPWRRD